MERRTFLKGAGASAGSIAGLLALTGSPAPVAVQAGATLWDVYRQLFWRFGKTLPGGSCYSVGAGGHICGGGYGLLSRKFGLTVDWLTGVDVVTLRDRSPALTHVSRKSTSANDQLLYFAHTGGGGGNFGIVTRYEFAELPTAPQNAELVILSWDWADIVR